MPGHARYNLITRGSRFGRAALVRDRSVPRIDDAVLDCAIYLYQNPKDALAGSEIGGSGFLVELPINDGSDLGLTICVTNRHVIERGSPVVRLNTMTGKKTTLYDVPENEWIFHETQDLAIIPVPVHAISLGHRRVSYQAIVTKEMLAAQDLGPGTDTFMVGRFIHRDGGQTNIPTTRFGNIAQMPSIIVDEESGRANESYLIETRSIGGFSGSPIFAFIEPFDYSPKKQEIKGAYWGPGLLAIDWAQSSQEDPVMDVSGRETDMFINANTGLTMAIPSWHLKDLLDGPVIREWVERANDDARLAQVQKWLILP